MDDISIPNAAQPIADGKTIDAAWYRALSKLSTFANSLQRSVGDQSDGLGTKAAKGPQQECFSVTYDFPADGSRDLILGSGFAWTITKLRTKTAAGTATVALKVDGSSVLSSDASTTQDEKTSEDGAAVAADDLISATLSSTSSDCEGLCITVEGTRTLA